MATNEENDLIGYDPLAWMMSDSNINNDAASDELCDRDKEKEDSQLINEEFNNVANDYSDNLVEDAEDNRIMEEILTKDDVKFESDNESIEDAADEYRDINNSELEEVVSENTDDIRILSQNFADTEKTESSQIDLDATLSIQHVVNLHEKLKNALAIHDEIEINASDVSSVDTSTLQLLVSLKRDAVKLQKKVTIIYPSPRFVESAKLLGLLDVLEVHDV